MIRGQTCEDPAVFFTLTCTTCQPRHKSTITRTWYGITENPHRLSWRSCNAAGRGFWLCPWTGSTVSAAAVVQRGVIDGMGPCQSQQRLRQPSGCACASWYGAHRRVTWLRAQVLDDTAEWALSPPRPKQLAAPNGPPLEHVPILHCHGAFSFFFIFFSMSAFFFL